MFQKTMTSTYTKNGALSLSTPDATGETSGRLSLFFKATRGLDDITLETYLTKSCEEDVIDTFILAFQTRDARGGKGERAIGRTMFALFLKKYPSYFTSKLISLIPEYGRWDDLLHLFPNVISLPPRFSSYICNTVVHVLSNQLREDIIKMNLGKPISLAAKWAPTEGDSLDRKYKLVKAICKDMGINPKQYRKEFISPLRAYLNIVERLMCNHQWDEIDFSKVPSCAMRRLKKAFEKHRPIEFDTWKEGLKTGLTKVNAKQLFPYEIVKEIRKTINSMRDEVIIQQWKVLEREARNLGTFSRSVVIVDTSGSMACQNYLPLDIATSLGILISTITEGEFHNNVITFHEKPTFQVLRDGNIYDMYNQICRIPWGGSTNLQAVFDMILEKGKNADLTDEDMPKRLFIISDMQFNDIDGKTDLTNFEYIDKKYKLHGYTRPQIVFWNVNGENKDFPVSVRDDGTCLVSGASPSTLKAIFSSTSFNPYDIMRTTINDERYQQIRNELLNNTN